MNELTRIGDLRAYDVSFSSLQSLNKSYLGSDENI